MPRLTSLLLCFIVVASCARAQDPAERDQNREPDPAQLRERDRIRVNQLGFATGAPKAAVVVDSAATTFAVVDLARRDTVLRGQLGPARAWALSGETVRVARFDSLARPGRYAVVVPGVGASHPFVVEPAPLGALARAAIKGFYFQRVSEPLDARWAGPWVRPAGHPDDSVVVHPSAASPGRPAGTVISAPGGWYDAGDYNKYIVNSGISTATLLSIVEHDSAYAESLDVAIPERGGALPDVLDEALVNVRWMMRMQDPADGGVYHKLTNAAFGPLDEMPHEATRPTRYVVQKGTAAALDFAAVAAQASRISRRYPRALPGLADSLLVAARRAWGWARLHPDSVYDQARMNRLHDPDVSTGDYGDRRFDDERRWAAAELWATTREDSFLVAAIPTARDTATVPGWPNVGTLGLYTLLHHRATLPRTVDVQGLERMLLDLARPLAGHAQSSPYAVPMGITPRDFAWGSSAVAANQGIVLVQAWRLTRDTMYLNAARSAMDWLLGRNATGYSFVTGFGGRQPMAPHHRPSVGDTVRAPVPGLLVGGPNPGQQDKCAGYPSPLPARSYVDHECSYAANEIAINWNAPLAWLAAALDAIDRDDARRPRSGAARAAR